MSRRQTVVATIGGVLLILPLAYYLLVDLAVGDEACPVRGTDITARARWQWWPPGSVCKGVRDNFTSPPADRLWSVWLAAAGLLLLVGCAVRLVGRRA